MSREVRLQKFLSQAGVASRRAAETLMREGRVRVNGRTASELGIKVDPERDAVEVDGRRVRPAVSQWVMLYKPRGFMTTRDDPRGRRTIYELLPPELHGLFYVGRLDYDSEGLLLLTNDGDGAQRLQHPRHGVKRVYLVELDGTLPPEAQQTLRAGVRLEDGPARIDALKPIQGGAPGRQRWSVSLREGRNREVRRMFEAVGVQVLRLKRVRFGPIGLGELRRGEWRVLESDEVALLRRA